MSRRPQSYIHVKRNPAELVRAVPEAGTFTVQHQSPQGVNFCEQGDDKAALIAKVRRLAGGVGLDVSRVRDDS